MHSVSMRNLGNTSPIGNDMYMFCDDQNGFHQETWRLSFNETDFAFRWHQLKTLQKKDRPIPKTGSTGWAWNGKIWIFGGRFTYSTGYLDSDVEVREDTLHPCPRQVSNKLCSFDPVQQSWSNVTECKGDFPFPQYHQSSSMIKDKAYLCAPFEDSNHLFCDLHELDMLTLTWTKMVSQLLLPGHMSPTMCALSSTRVLICSSTLNDSSGTVFDVSSQKAVHSCKFENYWRQEYTIARGLRNEVKIIGGFYHIRSTEKWIDKNGKTKEKLSLRLTGGSVKTISWAPCTLEVSALRAIYKREVDVSPSTVGAYFYEKHHMRYF